MNFELLDKTMLSLEFNVSYESPATAHSREFFSGSDGNDSQNKRHWWRKKDHNDSWDTGTYSKDARFDISSNHMAIEISIKEKKYFARLISSGNFDFFDNDPGGYSLKIRIKHDEAWIRKVVIDVLNPMGFGSLSGRNLITCHKDANYPNETEAHAILNDIKTALLDRSFEEDAVNDWRHSVEHGAPLNYNRQGHTQVKGGKKGKAIIPAVIIPVVVIAMLFLVVDMDNFIEFIPALTVQVDHATTDEIPATKVVVDKDSAILTTLNLQEQVTISDCIMRSNAADRITLHCDGFGSMEFATDTPIRTMIAVSEVSHDNGRYFVSFTTSDGQQQTHQIQVVSDAIADVPIDVFDIEIP